jgi:hypothetical protein
MPNFPMTFSLCAPTEESVFRDSFRSGLLDFPFHSLRCTIFPLRVVFGREFFPSCCLREIVEGDCVGAES